MTLARLRPDVDEAELPAVDVGHERFHAQAELPSRLARRHKRFGGQRPIGHAAVLFPFR
jgi:hypothetical protein